MTGWLLLLLVSTSALAQEPPPGCDGVPMTYEIRDVATDPPFESVGPPNYYGDPSVLVASPYRPGWEMLSSAVVRQHSIFSEQYAVPLYWTKWCELPANPEEN